MSKLPKKDPVSHVMGRAQAIKVVVIGDPHFRIDNIEEVEIFIDRVTDLIYKENPDFVVCLGDLLHTHERLHTTALNKAYDFVKRLKGYKLYILVGNHDYIQNQQFLTENHWMNGMKEWPNVTIVDKVIGIEYNNLSFVFTPYVPNGRFIEALNTLPDYWKSADCIFAHQEFYGCKMGAIVSVDGDVWDKTYPNVISGHIHSVQRPQQNIYYTGASIQQAFGESDRNIIAVISFDRDGTQAVEEVDLCLQRKKIIYADIDDTKLLEKTGKNIKLTLSGSDHSEFKAFKKTETYKKLVDSGTKVVFKIKAEIVETQRQVSTACEISEDIDFKKILYDLVQTNTELMDVYDLIINGVESILVEPYL